jgi:hypothetical protein
MAEEMNEAESAVQITAEEFQRFLSSRYRQYRPMEGDPYEGERQWILRFSQYVGARVGSTLSARTAVGQSRAKGEDSIKVRFLNLKTGIPFYGEKDKIPPGENADYVHAGYRRVFRTLKWRENLVDRIENLRDLYENGNGNEDSTSDYWDELVKAGRPAPKGDQAVDHSDVIRRVFAELPPNIRNSLSDDDTEWSFWTPYNEAFNNALKSERLAGAGVAQWRPITKRRAILKNAKPAAIEKLGELLQQYLGGGARPAARSDRGGWQDGPDFEDDF